MPNFKVKLEVSLVRYSRYCLNEARFRPGFQPVSFYDFIELYANLPEKAKLVILEATLPL